MEPNKLENEFKKKLEERTIQPSNMAWDRLDAMLSVAEKKKKPKRTWMYIAASFLGFILIATLFLNQNDNTETVRPNNSTVVTAPEIAPVKTDDSFVDPQELPRVIKKISVAHRNQEVVAKVEKPVQKPEVQEQKIEMIKTNEPFIQKEEAVVNNNIYNRPEKQISAEEEAENLLSASLNNKVKKKSIIKVNSRSLLSNVEGELNESFRDKVLQSVNKNYNAVKTSLANRNRE